MFLQGAISSCSNFQYFCMLAKLFLKFLLKKIIGLVLNILVFSTSTRLHLNTNSTRDLSIEKMPLFYGLYVKFLILSLS